VGVRHPRSPSDAIGVCRDRFGIKPLYYRMDGDALLLASEIRQILAATDGARANPVLVRAFLAGDRDTVLEDTFFEGVHSVPPGCWFTVPLNVTVGRLEFQRYWDLDDFKESHPAMDYRTAVDRVGELMTNAVRSHSIADVEVGSLLSGGLDSSTIATLLVRERKSAPTFSFGFRSAAPQFCELPYVDGLVRREGMENHETSFSAEWIAENASRVVNALEEPPLAMPAFAQFRTFELCRRHGTTVILDGQGSDEIFAGYPYHERLLLLDHVRRGRWIRLAHEAKSIARRDSISTPRLLAKAFLEPTLYEVARTVRGSNRWIARDYGDRNGTADRSRTVNARLHHDVKWGTQRSSSATPIRMPCSSPSSPGCPISIVSSSSSPSACRPSSRSAAGRANGFSAISAVPFSQPKSPNGEIGWDSPLRMQSGCVGCYGRECERRSSTPR